MALAPRQIPRMLRWAGRHPDQDKMLASLCGTDLPPFLLLRTLETQARKDSACFGYLEFVYLFEFEALNLLTSYNCEIFVSAGRD